MPFDPTLPAANSPASSAQMRAQLQALFDLIQSIPAGPQGIQGIQGPPFADAVVDGVNTLNPGDAAGVTVSFDGTNVHFTFGIPRGQDGSNGVDGTNGTNGTDGSQGPPGPSVANSIVDAVNTLNPGDAASVQTSFDGTNVHFTFGIPRGNTGIDGLQGPAGPSVANSIVDAVNTLNPGDGASVQTSFDGSNAHFTFGIPRGDDGIQGTAGPQGLQGPPGPSVANSIVDGVTALNPGDNATVQTSFDGTNVHFTFGIPRGNDGQQGIQGPPISNGIVDSVTSLNPGDNPTVGVSFNGTDMHFTFGIPRGQDGSAGAQGPPGEVTNADMASAITNAISGTSSNTNAVTTLDTPFANDPPTLADMEVMRAKMNELILALRR